MTLLDNQMRIDLAERFNGCAISAAINISKSVKDNISTKGLPSYFFGNRNAKTVVVNLNPGEDADKCDSAWNDRTKDFGKSLDSFIEKYINAQTKYGDEHGVTEKGKADSFDVKQSAFLTPWEGSEIELDPNPDWSNEEYRMKAKTNVINNKLQLELVPYASAKFEINRSEIARFRPFAEILLDEIFAQERKYIIFASAKFETIFKVYNSWEYRQGEIEFIGKEKQSAPLRELAGLEVENPDRCLRGKCRVIRIHYKGKTYNALIAHTFPTQGLSKAYDLMQRYGEFCYDEYKSSTK